MSSRKVRLNPRQVTKARDFFCGDERMSVSEIAAKLGNLPLASVLCVLEMSDWKRPSRRFNDLSTEQVAEMREFGVERNWKAERIANLFGLEYNDRDFHNWLSSHDLALPEKPQPSQPRASSAQTGQQAGGNRDPRPTRKKGGRRRTSGTR